MLVDCCRFAICFSSLMLLHCLLVPYSVGMALQTCATCLQS